MRSLRRPLTFSNVVSLIAVFIALGGTALAVSVAENSVGSKQIRKNAVKTGEVKNQNLTGGDVKDESLTGADVDEATLQVNADSVGGNKITRVNYNTEPTSPAATIFEGGGVVIRGACDPGPETLLTATSSKENSSIYTFVANTTSPGSTDSDEIEGADFDAGDNQDLLAGADGDPALVCSSTTRSTAAR